ncbi:MAG: hypothetical protein CW338_00470 [Clostridiales bacterium]|nr:hypothetical protein [Clostridiales bacterium]
MPEMRKKLNISARHDLLRKGCALLLCLLLLTGCTALAATREEQAEEVLAGSRLTRYEHPVRAKMKSYAVMGLTTYKGTTIEEMSGGEECYILGESGEEYLIANRKGAAGYVLKSKVVPGDEMLPEDIPGDPLEAVLEDADIPYLMMFGEGTALKGKIRANRPVTEVRVMFYNFRNIREECGVCLFYSASENVTEIDLSKLSRQILFKKMRPGDRYLTVSVRSGDQEAVLYNSVFCVNGHFARQYSAVEDCTYNISQRDLERLTDGSCIDGWKMNGKSLIITFPAGEQMEAIQTEWLDVTHDIRVIYTDAGGNVIGDVTDANEGGFYITYYGVPAGAVKAEISAEGRDTMLTELYVYRQGEVPVVAQNWQQLPDKVDVMLIIAHRDDECLFFSGIVPWCVSRGKTVAIVYMTDPMLGRPARTETLNALWVLGERYYPVYLGMVDERATWEQNIEDWGGYDNMYMKTVEVIRRYKPDVLIGHDLGGEFGHFNHRLTADATLNGVLLAGDPSNYPESAEKYGVWDVPKFYMHLYDPDHRIGIDWYEPDENLMNLSPMAVAYIAFEKHTTEAHHSEFYSLDVAGKENDNTCFGLYRSLVGDDVLNNDFFENLE